MSNVAGRPNKRYEVLDRDGTFSDFWYRFMEQIWVRSGGSLDGIDELSQALELVETMPRTEELRSDDDLISPNVILVKDDDLSPVSTLPLSSAELTQLSNINSVTITNVQWAFLGDFNQALTTTSDVQFNDVAVDGIFNIGSGSFLTISSGAVTITSSYHKVDTESSAATDDLDTINGGTEGDRLILMSVSSARDVVVKDGGGNIRLEGDFTLDTSQDTIELFFSGTNWHELSRSNNA